MSRQPAGANHFLKLRRSLDEHLQSGRMTWNEFAMFVWLCLKASPRNGVIRTSWPQLGIETRLSVNHVEQLCRTLRRKRYVWYPWHRGRRGQHRLIELAIDKYPTVGGRYTDLSDRFAGVAAASRPGRGLADVPTEPTTRPADFPRRAATSPTELAPDPTPRAPIRAELAPDPTPRAPISTELDMETREESPGSPPGRLRPRRERDRDRECARARDRRNGRDRKEERARNDGRDHPDGHDPAPAWREAIATPVAIRELLAAQPWWRPPADDRASARGADAGGTPDGGRATAPSGPPPGGAPQ